MKAKRLRDKVGTSALASAAFAASLILAPAAYAGDLPVEATPYGGTFQDLLASLSGTVYRLDPVNP